MNLVIAFFLVFSVICGIISGLFPQNDYRVKSSKNIFTFFFSDKY